MPDQSSSDNSRTQSMWNSLTLLEYIQLRNGVPLGDSQSLKNMLQRSFCAPSFTKFWQYWNPIWGYGLGKYVYTPLQRIFPPLVAVLLTFAISGLLHDIATMLVRGETAFLFTIWFFFLGIGVALDKEFKRDVSHHVEWVRVLLNLAYLLVGLVLALAVSRFVFL